MTIFVAGGTGVIGRASLKQLVEAGHIVRSTARGSDHAALVKRLGAEPVAVDLFDPDAVRRAIRGSDAVVRLTTKIPNLMKMRNPANWAETNRLRTEGARILVDAAIAEGVPVYVHESVTFVYREGGSDWLDENAPADTAGSAIMQAALDGEREALRFSQIGGRGVVLRFAAFYGADAPSTQDMIQMVQQRKLPQVGAGSNYFSSIYVPDAGRAVAASIDLPAGIYNVADDEPVSFAVFLDSMIRATGALKPLRLPGFLGRLLFGPTWIYFSRSHRITNEKLKTNSSWRPLVPSAIDGWPLIAADHSHSMVPGGLWVKS
jgi:nucleoside-diphosphate-sugar epimerase